MGFTSFSSEFVSPVSPARMFKAGVLDLHSLIPKLMPEVVTTAAIVQGDGGVGSIKQFNFTEAFPVSHVKDHIDVLDKEKFVCKYSLVEGGEIGTKLKSACYEIKFEPSSDGGSICKLGAEYNVLDGVTYTEDEIKVAKDGMTGMYKTIEAHLLTNPHAYA
ncbi:PREDICTED: pathogenesis-related protein STH-21-like [Nelumbo nucifera]|uniref:Pathogenesis-related protein STH-21-like n=2 Tax=Nelumbo nucifera TaxID=4432 RepID=A0A1U7Z0F0_NELNU|nr:PREDICTED: pathogenesis-related protein STH-21-like [Nelumbo nucifera]DAD33206.1 TPA_asm: hypothetical protein HUJ06_012057 [Nelumbo nucifera]